MAPNEFGSYGEASFNSMESGIWSEERTVEVILNPSLTLDSNSYIKKIDNEKTISSNAFIKKIDNDKTIYSDSYIKKINTKDILSNAYKKRTYAQAITSESFILTLETESLFSNSFILKSGNDKQINSDSYIAYSKQLPHGFQRSMWYNGTRYWRSSYDYENSRLIFEYTTDKVNWIENTNARISVNAYNQEWGQMKWADYFMFDDDNTRLFILYKSGNDIKARRASGYPNANFSWESEYTVFDASVDGGEYLYCSLSTRDKDRLVASATWHTGSDYRVRVARGTAKNDVTAWDPSETISSETNTNKATYNRILRYDTSNDDKYYIIWNEGTSLKGRYYDGSWNTTESISTLNLDILDNYRSYFGSEYADSTDLTKHVAYKATDGSIAHRYNTDVSITDNWSSEVLVSNDNKQYSYICIVESGVALGRMYILSTYGEHPDRLVEICRSVSPYTTWSCSYRYIDSTVIALISESPTSMAYTYQNDTNEVYTIFFQETSHILSDASIKTTYSKEINSNAYIKIIDITNDIYSDSYILKSGNDKIIYSDAYILGVTAGSIYSNAYIKQTYPNELYSNSYIKKIDNIVEIDSNTCIMGGALIPITSRAYIKKIDNTKTIKSDSYIKIESRTYYINSNSYIFQTYPKYIYSNTYIKKLDNTEIINSNSYVLKVYESQLLSDAYIKTTSTKQLLSLAYIKTSYIGSVTSDAEIVYVGNVFLVSPTDASLHIINYGDNVTYVWRIPDTYVSTGRVDCVIEIASDNLFTDIIERKSTIRDLGFEYYDGSNWQTYPDDGVTSGYFGNNARYTNSTNPGTYYWRVKGCVR